jgi:hypothetical protein
MFADRERLLEIDIPVRRELLQGREVTIACVPDTVAREAASAIDTALSGEVSQEDLLRLLSDCQAPARAERGYSLEDLAQNVEAGSGVIALVNAGEFSDCVDGPTLTDANCAVVIEGVARDAHSQEICGFLVRDPTAPDRSVFVDSARTGRMWLDSGGWQIVPGQPSL